VSGSGISWDICKSAPRSRQITMPAPHHSVFTGRMPFLSPNQQRQSTEGNVVRVTVAHISRPTDRRLARSRRSIHVRTDRCTAAAASARPGRSRSVICRASGRTQHPSTDRAPRYVARRTDTSVYRRATDTRLASLNATKVLNDLPLIDSPSNPGGCQSVRPPDHNGLETEQPQNSLNGS